MIKLTPDIGEMLQEVLKDDVPVKSVPGEPIYNSTRTVLYEYPSSGRALSFTVPSTVKIIKSYAFFSNYALEELILPEGIVYIEKQAFSTHRIKHITIPKSVKKVESMAFWYCQNLQEINFLCDISCVESEIAHCCEGLSIKSNGTYINYDDELKLLGENEWIIPKEVSIPHTDTWETESFVKYAKICTKGNTLAMMNFADFLERTQKNNFGEYAANFWRYLACQSGDKTAKEWKNNWKNIHPRKQIPIPIPPNFEGCINGDRLRALGFLFFDPKRQYDLEARYGGIFEVSSMYDEYGADCDGFGYETLSDWWYLDEFLNPIPGIGVISGYSGGERRRMPEKFGKNYQTALKILGRK
ncbi:MAG: leucine-rich repeat domain-containing protein [Clostridia bacterium]|nr:leucine-rich repeat domain-containing protein [Clostridia bacterium]